MSNNRDSFGTTDGSTNRDSFGSTQSTSASEQKGSKRGNYKCQRCNVPKKGHVCPYQLVYKKQSEQSNKSMMLGVDVGIQNEIGGVEMTVRVLDLGSQGFAESYIDITTPPIATPEHYAGIEDVTQQNVITEYNVRPSE